MRTCVGTVYIDTRYCHLPEETWTTTFLRFAQGGQGGTGCILLNTCLETPAAADLRVKLSAVEVARYRYVRYTIYSINVFFSTWHDAMHNGIINAQGLVENIVLTIDPSTKQRAGLSDNLTAIGIGLAFLVIPEAAALEAGVAAVAQVFLTSIQQASTIAKTLWPPGTNEEATYEYGKLSSQLTDVAQALGPRIEDALAFTTFLVSQALVDQGWHAVIAIGVDPLDITYGTRFIPDWAYSHEDPAAYSFGHDLNCHTYDNNSQCDNAWWYSENQDSAYTLAKDPYYGFYRDPEDTTDPTNLIRTIFNN
ncbi:MAG: hypothetical protein M1835_008032 [Candelina submexicana]|nr:MAG: hypothetical protein M1835_008032 [Candelina submexicana]